jgi:hypothetical protein
MKKRTRKATPKARPPGRARTGQKTGPKVTRKSVRRRTQKARNARTQPMRGIADEVAMSGRCDRPAIHPESSPRLTGGTSTRTGNARRATARKLSAAASPRPIRTPWTRSDAHWASSRHRRRRSCLRRKFSGTEIGDAGSWSGEQPVAGVGAKTERRVRLAWQRGRAWPDRSCASTPSRASRDCRSDEGAACTSDRYPSISPWHGIPRRGAPRAVSIHHPRGDRERRLCLLPYRGAPDTRGHRV